MVSDNLSGYKTGLRPKKFGLGLGLVTAGLGLSLGLAGLVLVLSWS